MYFYRRINDRLMCIILEISVFFVELLKSDPGSTEASAGFDNRFWPNKTPSLQTCKIIHHKETYKFCFDHFLEKRTVFILIRKTLLKIKSCGFRGNNARYEKMLTRKIVHLKKIYNFDFDHFLIKRTVFVLIVKNVTKNKKFNFPDKLCDIQNKC